MKNIELTLNGNEKSIIFSSIELQITETTILIFQKDKITTIDFKTKEQLDFFMKHHFERILNEGFKKSDTDMNVLVFKGSHQYVFSKSLNWGHKYYNPEAIISFEMLAREKADFDARKVLYEDIRNLLILKAN